MSGIFLGADGKARICMRTQGSTRQIALKWKTMPSGKHGAVLALTKGRDDLADPRFQQVPVYDADSGAPDTKSGKVVHWTGKSYPTTGRQHTLVHVKNLGTHFLELGSHRPSQPNRLMWWSSPATKARSGRLTSMAAGPRSDLPTASGPGPTITPASYRSCAGGRSQRC